ncbi:NAD(P)/FAD-dependent oxidoreductase [Marinomonas pollencensis]|uniref:Amine oxidase domain-containing protein n=1 Tax=Marinomonas pollencensis TaxID=491954 RepID=A0A3E0DTT4_9GAMM|nr:FAD-dependent oxidoreductase [Marinomonas pollencensis]REG86979.1 hypothetical protein DFP81_101549 [Marinomonas pollencensis]
MNDHLKHDEVSSTYDVAIIGAGIAGSLCANILYKAGLKVCVLEKSRGTGGRASSKRRNHSPSCDLGTPYICATHAQTQATLSALEEVGIATQWQDPALEKTSNNRCFYVGNPTMSAITRHWLDTVDLITNTRIHHIERAKKDHQAGWLLQDYHLAKSFFTKYIIIATPAPQAAILLANIEDSEILLQQATQAGESYQAQWALWVETEKTSLPAIVEPTNSLLKRLIKDSQKPNRDTNPHDLWVLQSTPEWAQQHLNNEPKDIAARLISAFEEHTKLTPKAYGTPHRWLLSRSQAAKGNHPYIWDKLQGLGLTGDWLCQNDAEGAMLSAYALCEQILNEINN